MPDPFIRVGDFLRDWWRGHLVPLIQKAPRERPDLLIYVCGLALLVIAIYAVIWVHSV